MYETYGVKQAQEWLGYFDPATTVRHYVRVTTVARAKAVAGLDEVARADIECAEESILEDAEPALDNGVALAGPRRWPLGEARSTVSAAPQQVVLARQPLTLL